MMGTRFLLFMVLFAIPLCCRAASFDVNGPSVELRRIQYCTHCGKAVNVTTLGEETRFLCPACETPNTVLPKRQLHMAVYQICPRCQSLLDVHDCPAGESIRCPVCHAAQSVLAEATLSLNPVERDEPPAEPLVVRRGDSEGATTLFSPGPASPVPSVDGSGAHPAARAMPDGSRLRDASPSVGAKASPASEDAAWNGGEPVGPLFPQGVEGVDDTGRSPARNRRNFGTALAGRTVALNRFPPEPPARTRRTREYDEAGEPVFGTEPPDRDVSLRRPGDVPADSTDTPRNPDEEAFRDDPCVSVAGNAVVEGVLGESSQRFAMAEVIDENGPVIPRGAIERPSATLLRPRMGGTQGYAPASEYADSATAPVERPGPTQNLFRVAAMVNGQPIRSNEVEVRLSYALEQERMRMGRDGQGESGYRALLRKAAALRGEIIDALVNDRLVLLQAEKDGLRPAPADIAAEAERIRIVERRSAMDEDMLQRARERCIMRMVGDRLTPREPPLPRMVKQHYARNRGAFMEPARATLRAVVVHTDRTGRRDARTAREIIQDAVTRLQQTGDFSAVVREFSEDIFASDGGIQVIGNDMHLPVDGFASHIRARLRKAKTGDVVGPVPLGNGLALLFVERLSGGMPRPLEDVQDEVIKAIRAEQRAAGFAQYIADLRKGADIRVY